MTENETQKISFFTSTNRKETAYKKFSGLSFLSFFKNLFVNKEAQEDTSFLIQQIKNISDSDYEKFNQYLFNQKHFYDAKVNYISTAIIEAQKYWKSIGHHHDNRNILGMDAIRDFKYQLTQYHFMKEGHIQIYADIYNKINSNLNSKNIEVNLRAFVDTYSLFKSNTYQTDSRLESWINNMLFNDKYGTMEYFQKNDVYNKAMALELKLNNDEPIVSKAKKGM